MKLTAPQIAALRAAAESPNGRLPLRTNYNTTMALWRHNYVDRHDVITAKGRAALSGKEE